MSLARPKSQELRRDVEQIRRSSEVEPPSFRNPRPSLVSADGGCLGLGFPGTGRACTFWPGRLIACTCLRFGGRIFGSRKRYSAMNKQCFGLSIVDTHLHSWNFCIYVCELQVGTFFIILIIILFRWNERKHLRKEKKNRRNIKLL